MTILFDKYTTIILILFDIIKYLLVFFPRRTISISLIKHLSVYYLYQYILLYQGQILRHIPLQVADHEVACLIRRIKEETG